MNNPAPENNETCQIAEGTIIKGEFKTTSNVRLDGTINGNVQCDGRFIMGKKGTLNGNIKTDRFSIEGNVEGELEVSDILHLLGTANVNGKVLAGKLLVEEGAQLNGDCNIGPQKPGSK
jgi:cytoskeletal protein CcmA (bactofilin family)